MEIYEDEMGYEIVETTHLDALEKVAHEIELENELHEYYDDRQYTHEDKLAAVNSLLWKAKKLAKEKVRGLKNKTKRVYQQAKNIPKEMKGTYNDIAAAGHGMKTRLKGALNRGKQEFGKSKSLKSALIGAGGAAALGTTYGVYKGKQRKKEKQLGM